MMMATIKARISRMRFEVRKDDEAEESSSSVPTPKTPAPPSVAVEAWAAAGIAVPGACDMLADCWKVCWSAGWTGRAGDCEGTAWVGPNVESETVGSPVARKLSTWVLAPAALKALVALAALLELVADIAEAPEIPEVAEVAEVALPGWSERGRVTWVGGSEDLTDGEPGWDPGGDTTASCGEVCGDWPDWGWPVREARAASTAGSPSVPSHSRRAG